MLRKSWVATDAGRVYTSNHDAFFASDESGVYAVADGFGSGPGEFASRLAVQRLVEAAPHLRELASACERDGDAAVARNGLFDHFQDVIERTNLELFNFSREDPNLQGAATTLTALVLHDRGACIAHAGDCRLYLLRQGQLQQLTEDHTLAAELMRAGKLKSEDTGAFRYKNVVARSLGERATIRMDLLFVDVLPGDTFLVCSDGLSDGASDVEIERSFAESALKKPAQRLVEDALRLGGGDNITAVVVTLVDESPVLTTVTETPVAAPSQHTMKLSLLKNLSFCQHLTDDERMKVLRYLHEVEIKQGQIVFRQGDDGQDLYLVVQGTLDVAVDGSKVTTVGTGGHFGEIALVSGQARSATVTAREAVRLLKLSRLDFFDLSHRDQALAVKILWSFTQTLAGRVTQLSTQLAQRK